MNYFAHALPFFDRPYFLAGAAVPDWLMVADRQVRLRTKQVLPFLDDQDEFQAAVAGGVLQHLADDALFHNTRTFAETSLELTVLVRDALGAETGLRPSFLGHVMTELLLDAWLIAAEPDRLAEYYRVLDSVDPRVVEAAVNRMTPRQTERLGIFMGLFIRERVLWDYLENDKLLVRLNQIMRRLRLDLLPDGFAAVLSRARNIVDERAPKLLDCLPTFCR